jgi:hypothetical protein
MKYRVQQNTKKNPDEAKFSAPVQAGPRVHTASYTGFFPRGKAAGAEC